MCRKSKDQLFDEWVVRELRKSDRSFNVRLFFNLLLLCLGIIMLCSSICLLMDVGVARASNPYKQATHWIDKSNMDTPIHAVIGTVGTYLTYQALPDTMNPYLRSAISFAVPVLASAVIETFDKNYNWGDVGEVAAFSGIIIPIISIDF